MITVSVSDMSILLADTLRELAIVKRDAEDQRDLRCAAIEALANSQQDVRRRDVTIDRLRTELREARLGPGVRIESDDADYEFASGRSAA